MSSEQWKSFSRKQKRLGYLSDQRCAERDKLFGRAMTVLKGLSMAVKWELAPAIMKEIDAICTEFEADAILKGDS